MGAPSEAIWRVIEDPFAMPRWWPGVERIEGVEPDRFTQVLRTKRGRTVRMDFRVIVSDPPGSGDTPAGHRSWEQEVAGTPFERVLNEAVTEVLLDSGGRRRDPGHDRAAPEAARLLADGHAAAAARDQQAARRGARRARADHLTLPTNDPWSTTGPGVVGLFCVSIVSSRSL